MGSIPWAPRAKYKSVQSQLNRESILQFQHTRQPPCLCGHSGYKYKVAWEEVSLFIVYLFWYTVLKFYLIHMRYSNISFGNFRRCRFSCLADSTSSTLTQTGRTLQFPLFLYIQLALYMSVHIHWAWNDILEMCCPTIRREAFVNPKTKTRGGWLMPVDY